jgi:hypothetical protein
MLDRYKSRISLTVLRSGKDALSSANLSMPLKSFAEMVTDPDCQAACKALHLLPAPLNASAVHVPAVSETFGARTMPATFVASTNSVPLTSTDNMPLIGAVVTTGIPVPVSVCSAQSKSHVLESYMVTMPSLVGKVNGGREGTVSRKMGLDSDACMSLLSQIAINMDIYYLKYAVGTEAKIEPMHVSMDNRRQSLITEVLMGVTI